jgi:chromate reductase
MDDTLRILGFAGSLSAGSYNKALLHAAADFMPEGVDLEISDIGDIPAFNQDNERET